MCGKEPDLSNAHNNAAAKTTAEQQLIAEVNSLSERIRAHVDGGNACLDLLEAVRRFENNVGFSAAKNVPREKNPLADDYGIVFKG